jgi:hypothetical protein
VPVRLPSGGIALLITRYDDVRAILADHRVSKNRNRKGAARMTEKRLVVPGVRPRCEDHAHHSTSASIGRRRTRPGSSAAPALLYQRRLLTRPPEVLVTADLLEERPDQCGHVVDGRLEEEVAAVEQVDPGVGQVVGEGAGAGRAEDLVAAAPDCEQRHL